MTKKGHQKFSALKWKFFPKKVIQKCFRPPKLGANSPPMGKLLRSSCTTTFLFILLK